MLIWIIICGARLELAFLIPWEAAWIGIFPSLSCCQYFEVFPQDKNYKKFWFKNLNWHLWNEPFHFDKGDTFLLRSKFFGLTLLFSQSNCILICYNTLLYYVKIMQYNKNWNKIEAKVPDLIKAKLFNKTVTKAISLHMTVWFNQINILLTKKRPQSDETQPALQKMHKQDFVRKTCSPTQAEAWPGSWLHLYPLYQAASAGCLRGTQPRDLPNFSAGWPWSTFN